jgi:hypothetical protein
MLRHERRSGETVRIHPDTTTTTAIGDAVPWNSATTTALAHDDSAASDANTNARDSATPTFADTDADCPGDINSAHG